MASGTFDSKSETVGDILSAGRRARIVVPEFQRGYEWGTKHVDAFWKDIKQFRKESDVAGGPDRYFLGPIVILRESKTVTKLLDGQQRLATATILFSVLRDLAKELVGTAEGEDFAKDTQKELIRKEDGEYALELGETDKIFFRDFIQNEGAATQKPKLRTHKNIQNARDVLKSKIRGEIGVSSPQTTLSFLRSIRQTLRSDLVVASIPVESERDAFRIFETLNDRGLRLAVPDLLLNYLMREAKPDSDRKEIRDLWSVMVSQMGKRDINRFLRHMWVSNYGDLKSKDLFTAIKEHIEKTEITSLGFVRTCAGECGFYVQLVTFSEDDLGAEAAKLLKSILQESDSQAALPLLLSSLMKLNSDEFLKVCRWSLVFITRYAIIANLDASGMESVFFQLARDVRQALPEGTNSGKGLVTNCLNHVRDSLEKAAPDDNQIRAATASKGLSPDGASYVLTRIAELIQSPTKEWTKGEANLEHIYPQNPEDNEWGGFANHELMEPYLWNLGNLTIYGKKLNSRAANKEYLDKRKEYESKSTVTMTLEMAQRYTEWNVASIKQRSLDLTKRVLEIWNFKSPSRV